ncbi:unnamed protein product [Phytophthora fragariaefolia]|uniref:Unnamed protein product n=1 Tax=Phytophthora fragariaefolia TaxID=1490495 RepID=A0A9W6YQV8_9STRA|nr:unnamed protein product [Phytophthora fragariaefolia]
MRVLLRLPLPEHIEATEFMDGLRVGPALTQLFPVHANTMKEAIQTALQEVYSHRQARTLATAWPGNSAPSSAQGGSPGNGATSGLFPWNWVKPSGQTSAYLAVEGWGCLPSQRTAEDVLREVLGLKGSCASAMPRVPGKCRTPVEAGRPTGEDQSLHDGRVGGTRHGGLATAGLGTLESRKSSERLLVLHSRVRGALVSHVPTSGKSKGIRDERQGATAPAEFMGVADVYGVPQEVTVDSRKESAEASPDVNPSEPREASHSVLPEHGVSRREPRVGNVVPHGVGKALIAWEAGDTAFNVGNLVPREPIEAKEEGKVGEDASCVGNIVPHEAGMADDAMDKASSDVVAQGDSEPKANVPQTRSSDGHYHDIDSETGLRVKADVQLEVLPEELNSTSVMDEDVLEEIRKQCASRLGSKILKNLRIRCTKFGVTRQWPLPREQCEVTDAFFGAKAKTGMVRESNSPHSSPTFCVRKPNGKWWLVQAYNKLNSANGPAQTPIPRKDVLLNNMAGCTLYSALDLVDRY